MDENTGKDLLQLFEKLHINIGGLHKNVIKAWFDTDCSDMKNLLNWLCNSLTKDNFVSPQELTEYNQISNILEGYELDKEVNNLNHEYPEIFDLESNIIDIEILEDELQHLKKEKNHMEQCLMINENLNRSLSFECSNLTNAEINDRTTLKKSEEDCYKLAQELDELNIKLYEQLNKCGDELCNFEQASLPQFIGNFILTYSEENINNIGRYINEFVKKKHESTIIWDESSSDEDELLIIYNRIRISNEEYLNNKIKHQKLVAVDDYLNNFDLTAILLNHSNSKYQMKLNIELKHKEEQMLLDKLKDSTMKMTDLSQSKIKLAENQLKKLESKLNYLDNIANGFVNIITHFILINQLYLWEKENVIRYEDFFKRIVNYVNRNLQICQIRTDIMSEIINNYNVNESKPIEERCQLVNDCIKLTSNKTNNCLLSEALTQISDRKNDMIKLEKQLLITGVNNYWDYMKELKKDIEILKKNLICGPTNRTIIIPQKLQQLLYTTGSKLEEQKLSLKNAIQFSMQALKRSSNDKWKHKYQHLWMNFINNPIKVIPVMEEIENEFNSKQKLCFSEISK